MAIGNHKQDKKLITILIPAYNEEEVLDQLINRLESVKDSHPHYDFEFLFVNDGSEDHTLQILKKYNENTPYIRYIDLSRNFGKEIAMLAGFDCSKGDAVVILDADLQQPPELISEMIEWWEKGYEDVYAVRVKREGESRLKEWTSKSYFTILQKLSSENVYPLAGDFRLLDKKCIEALQGLRETERYTKECMGGLVLRKKELTYSASDRVAGVTKWSWAQLFKLAIDGMTSYSTVPLKIWSYVGLIISFLAFFFLAYELGKTILFGTDVNGYPTMIASILFLGGIQLISLGFIGEYLGRVFVETKEDLLILLEKRLMKNKFKGLIFMEWLKNTYRKYQEMVEYLLFGVLTTVVNIVVFFLLATVFSIPYLIANAVSIIVAILFAFFTNKKYVFKSEPPTFKLAFKEFYLFVGLRLISGLVDMLSMWTLVDFMNVETNSSKILTQFNIVLLNYIASKRYIFK